MCEVYKTLPHIGARCYIGREFCEQTSGEASSTLVYKIENPFTEEKRFLYFFSDPPHLIKTVRNCWLSKHCNLWVCL